MKRGRLAYAGLVCLSLSCRKEEAPERFSYPREESPKPPAAYSPMAEAPRKEAEPEAPRAPAPPPAMGSSAAPPGSAAPQDAGAAPLKPATDPGCKEGMARIGSFCIDRFEIVLVDASGGRLRHNIHPPEHMSGLSAISIGGVNPQGHLSREQSEKACRNAGKRLCTSDEWGEACMAGGNPFPYGAASDATKCNVDKRNPHILDYYFPEIPHPERTGKQFNDPLLLLDPAYQTKTGQMAGCVTPGGVYDLDGNMSEWVAETEVKGTVTFGTFRGAPFSGHANEGCARKTTAHDARYYDYSTGTRCCTGASGKAL